MKKTLDNASDDFSIDDFKDKWPTHLEEVYSDEEIARYIENSISIEMAINRAVDHMLAQDLGEVQE